MSSVEVLLLNAVLYTITLIIFYKKYKLSVGVIVWLLYTVSAWSSYFFIQQPEYIGTTHDSEQTLFPCIYLYLIFFVSMIPLMKIDKIKKIDEVYIFNSRLFKWLMIVCTIIQFVFFIVDIPTMISVLGSGAYMYSALRDTIYSGELYSNVTQNVLLNKLSLLFSGIRIISTGLSIVAFFTFKRRRVLVNLFALSALLNNLRIIITQIGRGEMILIFLLYACVTYLVRDWIDEKKRRKTLLFVLPAVVIGVSFFWAISVSRFGNKANFFIFKYLGEPMNNFNGILFKNIQGSTNGRAYFSLFYRYILGESEIITANEKWNLIYEATGIRGDIFYTWVGGLIIEFGKIAPIIVAVVLNRMLNRVVDIRQYYTGDIIVLIFFLNFYLRGIFLFPTQNFEGMLMIIYVIVLYFVFRVKREENGSIVFKLPIHRDR